MNIRAGLREYILQTHNTKIFLKIQWGGLNPSNPPSGYATAFKYNLIFNTMYAIFTLYTSSAILQMTLKV